MLLGCCGEAAALQSTRAAPQDSPAGSMEHPTKCRPWFWQSPNPLIFRTFQPLTCFFRSCTIPRYLQNTVLFPDTFMALGGFTFCPGEDLVSLCLHSLSSQAFCTTIPQIRADFGQQGPYSFSVTMTVILQHDSISTNRWCSPGSCVVHMPGLLCQPNINLPSPISSMPITESVSQHWGDRDRGNASPPWPRDRCQGKLTGQCSR